VAGPLPYMKQLPQDYAKSLVSPAVPSTVPPPTYVNIPQTPPVEVSPGSPAYQLGGVWVGTTPPANPAYGWLWLNSNNNGLYVYADPGAWTQVGTNW